MTLQEFIEQLERELKEAQRKYKSQLGISEGSYWFIQEKAKAGTLKSILRLAQTITCEPTAQPVATDAPRIAPAQPCACGGDNVLVCDDNNRCAKCNGLAF